jgi:hypothetical protein
VKDRIWRELAGINFAYDSDFRVNRRVLLHAADLRHATDGFTSPPKEGMLWIFFFSPKKFRRLRPGSNPRSWVPEVSMLCVTGCVDTRLLFSHCVLLLCLSVGPDPVTMAL